MTRDLDLFWRNRMELGDLPQTVEQTLIGMGLSVATIQTSPSFRRLRVSDGALAMIVDLISEPMDAVDAVETLRPQT